MRGRWGIRYYLFVPGVPITPRQLAVLVAAHDILAEMRGSALFGTFR